MKQSQGLGLLRFARNDCKYFCPSTYHYQLPCPMPNAPCPMPNT
ncbi:MULTISPECIES: hypothetical protein [unclassified Tolypothrix]|nr:MULTISPECIES: hypothetical protein [unclassified Tolypothrix]